jgi:hypothetical protein
MNKTVCITVRSPSNHNGNGLERLLSFPNIPWGYPHHLTPLDLLTQGLDLLTQGIDLLSQGLELVSQGLEIVSQGLEIVSQGLELKKNITMSFPSHRRKMTSVTSIFLFMDSTEEHIGRAVRRCGLPRDQIFVTTKVWMDDHGAENTRKTINESLKKYVHMVILVGR